MNAGLPWLPYGGFTLLDNHWEAVELSASVACPGSAVAPSTKRVYANLLAGLDDVDLGQRSGMQFQQNGATLEVLVNPTGLKAQHLILLVATHKVAQCSVDQSMTRAQQAL